ncbi:hypothetical protein GC163_13340 [bacterium]|nr:hypothetical protein [bacterium]
MKRTFLLWLAAAQAGIQANGQETRTEPAPTAVLEVSGANQVERIGLAVTIDGLPYDQYWTQTFDALFDFADVDADGAITAAEIRWLPSARAVRLSLGNAFTPPVAPIESLTEITASDAASASRTDLHQYYRRHHAGVLPMGYGTLANTSILTKALMDALDADRNGRLSHPELTEAVTALRQFDTNDDELIGVGELVPHGTYPGNAAANPLLSGTDIKVTAEGKRPWVVRRLDIPAEAVKSPGISSIWQIAITGELQASQLAIHAPLYCEAWSVPGPLPQLFSEFHSEMLQPIPEPPPNEAEQSRRNRRDTRAWLTPLVDRDGNGEASPAEIEAWLAVQRQIVHGQLLISLYHGGGLFELIDTNHDAGLSVRELRELWKQLQAAGCTEGDDVDINRIPEVVFLVVSQGYPTNFHTGAPSVIDWFRTMDRNGDGDVSRREFTGSLAAFSRLDQDQDELISPSEAATVK